jgi:addiction module RelB/DinJ family antitoxin
MKTVLNLKIDKTTKTQAANLANEMGLTLSAVVNSFLKNYIRTRTIQLTAEPKMTPYLEEIIRLANSEQSEESKQFTSSKELVNWMKQQK